MDKPKIIRIFSTAIICYGAVNLIGTGSFSQFAKLFNPLSSQLIFVVYLFNIAYAIVCIYCGIRISRFEDWARKLQISVTSVNFLMGLFLNKITTSNLKLYIHSQQTGIDPSMEMNIYNNIIILTAMVSIFELSILLVLTRPNIVKSFKNR